MSWQSYKNRLFLVDEDHIANQECMLIEKPKFLAIHQGTTDCTM